MRVILKRHRPLLSMGETVVTYHKGSLMQVNLVTLEKRKICTLPMKRIYRTLAFSRVFERLLRTEVKTAVALSENDILISHRGSAYQINLSTGVMVKELQYRNGMSGPRRLTTLAGVSGFDDGVAFGEYTLNSQRKNPSAVFFRSKLSGTWKKMFEFEPGIVRHIHGLVPDAENGCVYILTGDFGKEAGIWKATNNFKEVIPILTGSQMYRSGGMIKTQHGFVYATDTALEQNYLYCLQTDNKGEWTLSELTEMDGSCVSNAETKDKALFSSTVEADESIRGWRSWINMKRGAGIKSQFAQLLVVDKKTLQTKAVASFKKDFLPYKLFQYGYVKLVDVPAMNLVLAYPIGVKKMDGKLIEFKYSELE